jgi:predicted metal-binding membrane protein
MSKSFKSGLGFRLTVGIPLLAIAAGAWYLSVYSLQTSSSMTMDSSIATVPIATMASMFSSPDAGIVFAFLVVWLVGMIAMMFPAMIPVMSVYSGLNNKEDEGSHPPRFVGPAIFLCGYLFAYGLLGLGLFAAVYLGFQLSLALPWLSSVSVVGLASVLFVTGIWQLTPWKEKSLSKCVSPMGFFLTHFKKGSLGALRMGAEHGVYCVGCCWLYMLVMLAVAAMSLISMALLSGLIIIEKAFVGRSSWFKWVSAGVFFSLAGLVVAFPSYLAFF